MTPEKWLGLGLGFAIGLGIELSGTYDAREVIGLLHQGRAVPAQLPSVALVEAQPRAVRPLLGRQVHTVEPALQERLCGEGQGEGEGCRKGQSTGLGSGSGFGSGWGRDTQDMKLRESLCGGCTAVECSKGSESGMDCVHPCG